MKTAAFVYGWSEGPWQSRRFVRLLEKEGISTTKNLAEADTIVAHSSGCYLVPIENKAKHIILIGLPYWPGRSLFKSVLLNLKAGAVNHSRGTNIVWWINKLSHNIWYIFARPNSSYFVLTRRKTDNLPVANEQTRITLVRNSDDSFCHPNIQELLPVTATYELVKMPGDHEDTWLSPKPYIDLLLKEL